MSTALGQVAGQKIDGFSLHAGTVPSWVEHFARVGYAAKAVIYAVIGLLALGVAFGNGGSTEGSKGALKTISEQPFGRAMLGLHAVALFGYVTWRFLQAIFDTEDHGTDAKGIVKRAAYGVSGLIYTSIAFWAGAVAFGLASTGGTGDGSKQSLTAQLMSMPFGIWLVGLVGLIIVGVAFAFAWRAYTAKFMERYNLTELPGNTRRYLKWVGQFGLAARAVTFLMIGGFVILAAIQTDPGEVRGLGGALASLASQPYGPWLLGIVACGMVAYAIYCAMNAKYRYFHVR